jgi:hypothetical protein
MFNKIYNYGLKGLGIGFIITNIMMYFSTFNSGEEYTIQGVVMIYIAWAIASVFFGIASIVYEISNLAMIYKMLIHFTCLALVAFTAVNYMMNNIYNLELNMFKDFFSSFLVIFIIIYFVLWTIHYFIEKTRIGKINKKFK